MMDKKRGRPSKEERQKQKLRRALEAGAGMVEISSSKIAWDRGHDKIKVTSGKLDYRAHQVLDCAADLIAQEHWFGTVIGSWSEPNTEEPERFLVPISYRQFLNFIGDKHNLDTEDVIKIFKAVPEVILEGEVDIPYCLAEGRWLRIKQYIDNICGLAIANEDKEFEQYRSERKLRGKGAGKEEPVFILLFSSPYGLAFFRNAMHRKGTQLQDRRIYKLRPEAQELFQAVRWKNDLIALNTEQISKIVGWVWPPKNFYDRVYRIRKMLKSLHENGFINKPTERGKKIEKKAWVFYVRKRKLISNRQNDN
ncbi:MAG: hypothetical protein GTO16_13170 [Candidatus Aminicenantes bacterium]|nr:hypothetical protein [Candidatus Aminicenantes bacterium]